MKKGGLYKTDQVKDNKIQVDVDSFAHKKWLQICESDYHKGDSQREILTEMMLFYLHEYPAFKK